jgi:hypothetical protein
LQILRVLSIFLLVLNVSFVYANATNGPKLNFTDLVNGPSTGLGDGDGSGVIVTIWGQNLGDNQSDSRVIFTDINGKEYNAAHLYYWKKADGSKPSGIANLYKSHRMQEIAFSIPDAPLGQGSIHLVVNGALSNKLPFLVREGTIYHIKANGTDSNTGSFSSPFASLPKVVKDLGAAGSTIYVHDDLVTENLTAPVTVYWNKSSASGGKDNHYVIAAYPNSQPSVIGVIGFSGFFTEGQVISKLKVLASNCLEGANGEFTNCFGGKSQVIEGTNHGRIIGNALSDIDGGCSTGELGAISGNNKNVSGLKIFGNEIYEYGCSGTSKFHHTTYIKIRSSGGVSVDPWEFGWNYLHDNDAKNGIHNFDLANGTSGLCGTANDTVKIHNNVIVNQGGAGIFIGTGCEWSNEFDVYNNLVINAGLPADWDNTDPTTSNDPNTSSIVIQDYGGFLSKVRVFNNSILNWNSMGVNKGGRACVALLGSGNTASVELDSNLCVTQYDGRYFYEENPGFIFNETGSSNNAWFYTGGGTGGTLMNPDIGGDIYTNLNVGFTEFSYTILPGSSLIQSANTAIEYDVYGFKRGANPSIGSVEFLIKPNPPVNLTID